MLKIVQHAKAKGIQTLMETRTLTSALIYVITSRESGLAHIALQLGKRIVESGEQYCVVTYCI